MTTQAAKSSSRITHHASRSRVLAFTLVEMIVVTGIIAVLAALIFPVTAAVKRSRDLHKTQTQLMAVSTAIQGYHDKMGTYPPDNLNTNDASHYQNNPLFYELRGASNNVQNTVFYSLDGSTSIPTASLSATLGVDGFANCTRGGAGDDRQPAVKFLTELKTGDYADITVNGTTVRLLGCFMDGPNAVPDPATGRKFTPWAYNASSPTNSPKSFDLWADVQIGSKIYRISSWSSKY